MRLRQRHFGFSIVLAVFQFVSFRVHAAEILSVFPTGAVKQVQQITVRFSTDMVPMGDPRSHKDPFTIKCAGKDPSKAVDVPKGSARWIDSKSWSYDFATPLASGISCTLTKVVQKDLANALVQGAGEFRFSTGGPAILFALPRYEAVEPDQYFILKTEGPVDEKSVETLAYFESSLLPGKIAVRLIKGADRETVIRSAAARDYEMASLRRQFEKKPAVPFSQIKGVDSYLVLGAKNRFAESSKVVLHWPRGILSASKVPVDEAQQFAFNVIPAFEVKFTCERANPERPCNPILDMQLIFTRPVLRKMLEKTRLVGLKNVTWTPNELVAEKKSGRHNSDQDFVEQLTFKAPFPDQSNFKLELPVLKDELGRALLNQGKFPLQVKTDDFTPLVKFAAVFGLLEKNAEPMLPVSVRNVEKTLPGTQRTIEGKSIVLNSSASPAEILKLYFGLQEKSWDDRRRGIPFLTETSAKKFQLPKPGGEREFELIGIPLKETGFHVVELASPRLGNALLGSGTMFVASSALVTNLAVHLKKGRESSAVWVTTLDKAEPVAGAEVSIVKKDGSEIARGKTDGSGIARFGALKFPCRFEGGQDETRSDLGCDVFAFAKQGPDVSFVSSQWANGIEHYRFNLSSEYLNELWGPISAHTVFDRALLQAGETLHFKTYLREYTQSGFNPYAPNRLPKRLLIVHRATNKTISLPFKFDVKSGSAVGEYKVPKDATLGFYEMFLSTMSDEDAKKQAGASSGAIADEEAEGEGGEGEGGGGGGGGGAFDWRGHSVGNFMVSEYRLPLMESTVKIQGANLIAPTEVKVDLSANYLSGGPARDLKVKVRASLTGGRFSPDIPGAEEYSFFAPEIHASKKETDANSETAHEPDLAFVFNQDLKLASTGGALAFVKGLPLVKTVRTLNVEMEYRDPNGEVKTGRSETTLYPGESIVGLRSDSWFAKAGKVSVAGIVLSPFQKPVAEQSYTVEAFRTEYITHRKRLVGGFYAYDSSTRVISLGKVCDGKSDNKGQFVCEASRLPSGSVTLQARVADSRGHVTFASSALNVYAEGEMTWWTPSDSDRIDLLPEKNSYQPGETAKFVLRSPFPVSTVLVTVEREGVLEAFVRKVSRDKPVIELPLKGNYAPNVFVSALALRGRVGDPQPTAMIDLARPSMKLGMAKIKVGWKAHELKVVVTPDKKRYHARDKAFATIHVTKADGSPMASGESEVAVAVVDEAIALLRKNWSLDLLSGMMGERPLAVGTSSAQSQVIGKRHFGSKAKPPGGGGGGASAENRELFDPLLMWLPRLKLDAKGEAKITIPLNDSMTSFRITAVGNSGVNHFGSGSAVIESSKDLILYSGFAPVVRDGDQIKNALTIRNTTAKPMHVELTVKSAQLIGKSAPAKIPSFDLKASEAKVIAIPIDVPGDISLIEYEIAAKDTLGGFSDALKIKSRVDAAVPAQVLHATLFQLEKPNSIPVQQPKDAIPNRGGLVVDTSASLMASLSGVKSYMDAYPYSCLEQRISKAVVLEDGPKMKETLQSMPSYLDGSGLLKFFPQSICGSVQLSRYVLSIIKANGYEIPVDTRDRVLSGMETWLKSGEVCHSWWQNFEKSSVMDQQRLLVIETLSNYGRFQSAWMNSVNVTPNLWTTTALTSLHRLLTREASAPNRDALLKQTENILRSRVNYQGTLMNLQGKLDDSVSWELFSSHDQEAIGVFGIAIDAESWKEDVGRLARGITARQKRGVWDTTTADAWGVTEMRHFSKKFEKEKVTGFTKISPSYSLDWSKNTRGEKTVLKWPAGSESKSVPVTFAHQGGGKPWVLLQTKSAIPLKKPWDLGYSVTRKVTRVSQENTKGAGAINWKNGDVANVELTITAKYDQPWVVIRDPIPAGATHLGNGLDGGSAILDKTPKSRPGANQVNEWPSEFEEKTQSHFMSYAAYLMKGTYKTNYRIRLNSSGDLKLPPSHIEAMYSPESFGEVPIAPWIVAP